ncbi:MAG: ABC transporter permease [Planctomycetota bacterium]
MALPFAYHARSLLVRKTTTALTILVVAAVVAVFAWMVGFASALQNSLSAAGDPQKLLVLRRGATAESNSAIPVDEMNKLNQLADLGRDSKDNEPLISPELMVQVSLPRIRDGGRTSANVAVRGVTQRAFAVHRNVKPLDRMFSTGTPEVIVGSAAAKQFAGLEIGKTLRLGYGGDRDYTIVGFFSADGGPMESEIWGYLPSLMNSYQRTMYSSASIRLQSGADSNSSKAIIDGPTIQLAARTEAEYWSEQSQTIRKYLGLSYALVGVMCLAAVFSIANTMFALVAGRTREVAMLRTIGYSARQIMFGFVMECMILSVTAGVLGCAACVAWLSFAGRTKDMFGASTFTTMAFEIRLTPSMMATALVSVLLVGLVGAIVPAIRASRLEVVSSLREP